MDAVQQLPAVIDDVAPRLARQPLCRWHSGSRWVVVADLHGDLPVLEAALELWHRQFADHNLCFLGDYVDRGPDSLEVLLRVLQTMAAHPERVVLLRGNHETISVAQRFGTGAQLRARDATRLWPALGRIFAALPLAAVLDSSILAVHGGLPKDAPSLDALGAHPHDDPAIRSEDPTDGTLTQFFWNDPDLQGGEGFSPNDGRGEGVWLFGRRVLCDYLDDHDLVAMVRGHQPFRQGWRSLFDGRLVSFHTSGRYPRPLPPHLTLLQEGQMTPLRLPETLWDGEDAAAWDEV